MTLAAVEDFPALQAELVILDDAAAQTLAAIEPRVIEGLPISHGESTGTAHVGLLVTSDAAKAAASATALRGQRQLVFTLLLADAPTQELAFPHLVCPELAPPLTALRRLLLEPSLIGIDFTDYAPLFRYPGRIGFAHRAVSFRTHLHETFSELGREIAASGQRSSSMVVVLACGERFTELPINTSGYFAQIDDAATAILAPQAADGASEVMLGVYEAKDADDFSASVFFRV